MIASTPFRIESLETSPDGNKLLFLSNAVNQRQEKYEDVELYVLELSRSSSGAANLEPRRITRNQAVETRARWAKDSRHVFFSVEVGDVSGPYRDLQPHLYWVDTDSSKIEQWDQGFAGPVEHYAVTENGLLASARLGTEVQMYGAIHASDKLQRVTTWPGTFADISVAEHSSKVAFVYSSLTKPEEIYLADNADKLDQAIGGVGLGSDKHLTPGVFAVVEG